MVQDMAVAVLQRRKGCSILPRVSDGSQFEEADVGEQSNWFSHEGFSNWKHATVSRVSHVSQTSGGGYDCPAYSLQRCW